jgi:hypothetical protein
MTGRVVVTALVYVGTLVPTAIGAFVIVMILAGPHAGLLPSWLEPVVLAAGWLAVLIVPVLVARAAWRRMRERSGSSKA